MLQVKICGYPRGGAAAPIGGQLQYARRVVGDTMSDTIRRALLALCALALLASCDMGGSSQATAVPPPTPTSTPVPTPTPTPKQIAESIGRATQEAPSVHFAIALGGAPVYSDPSKFLTIQSIDGDLRRPDGVLATVKAGSAASTIELKVVSLAGKQYVTNPITRGWFCAAAADGIFDPGLLFDEQRGINALLQSELSDVSLVGTEDVGGQPSYHLKGTIAGAPLLAISSNSLGLGPVQVDIWADVATLRMSRVVAVDTGTAADPAGPSTWTVTFSDYGKPVDVRAPIECP
jgi:lipoprotein LprG